MMKPVPLAWTLWALAVGCMLAVGWCSTVVSQARCVDGWCRVSQAELEQLIALARESAQHRELCKWP
jgi:hypothetical protein